MMKTAWIAVATVVAVWSVQAMADPAPGWKWDAPSAPAPTDAPQPLAPQSLAPPPAHPNCDAPPPGAKLPPDCAPQAAPDTGALEDTLAPPTMAGSSGNNRAKKVAH